MEITKVSIGLIKGRHELPVESYIFDSIEDVTDITAIESKALDRFKQVYVRGELVIYAETGMTFALVAVLNAAIAMNWLTVVVMHFDAVNKTYFPQTIAS